MTPFKEALIAEHATLSKRLEAINTLLAYADAAREPEPATPEAPGVRKRKPMNAAARKAHSLRMKAFWARKRKEKK